MYELTVLELLESLTDKKQRDWGRTRNSTIQKFVFDFMAKFIDTNIPSECPKGRTRIRTLLFCYIYCTTYHICINSKVLLIYYHIQKLLIDT